MNLPKQRHPYCSVDSCDTCLSDSDNLAEYLYQATSASRKTTDILSDYRIWLDKNKIPAETEFGWPRPEVFNEANINAYIKSWDETEDYIYTFEQELEKRLEKEK